MFTRRFERLARRTAALLAGAALFASSFAVWALWPARQAVGYEPEQPLGFSHKTMAGDAKIPCLYCHQSAESGPHAGIPTVQTCMNCHSQVRPKDRNGNLKADFVSLLAHIDVATGQATSPIAWQKVDDVSDFAYFDHSRHTVGARIECAECHGPVDTMVRVRRVHSLKMEWCLACHRKPPEEWRTDGREARGPTNCSTCHR